MRQVVQNLASGQIEVLEVPVPMAVAHTVVIRTRTTLVSSGTEKMLVDFARSGWFDRARQQPDKVRQAFDKIRTDGLGSTIAAIRNKLQEPVALGYCNVGIVTEVGGGISGFAVGDRVVSNGPHAGFVRVGQNLCAKVPDGVDDESAAFAVLGAIALQGMRLAEPTLGECFAVSGLGLVGLLAVQLLRANGCRVIGLDFDATRLALARQFGAETIDLGATQDPVADVLQQTKNVGVDGVLICASAKSSDPVHVAAQMCRKRGRIILVGVTGLELSRDDFYKKELTFQVSCSYGPGRYDPDYEGRGVDYPLAFVRWTEQRNIEAVLQTFSHGRLDIAPLISHRFDVDDAQQAYDLLARGAPMAMIFRYDEAAGAPSEPLVRLRETTSPAMTGGRPTVGVLGAGNYARGVLLPELLRCGTRLKVIASTGGLSAAHSGRQFGFEQATSDPGVVLNDPQIDTVVIATRHDSHARLVIAALDAGKHVFVEKPLALNAAEISAVQNAYQKRDPGQILTVGFNRRFAPLIVRLNAMLELRPAPYSFVYTVSAGRVPIDHWVQREEGGGRIVGEACHFIDLLRFLARAPITRASASFASNSSGKLEDIATISLEFGNGSLGAIHYFANGGRRVPKERLEIFCGGAMVRMNNFTRLENFGWSRFARKRLWRQDKGQRAFIARFLEATRGCEPPPIPAEELFEVAQVTCAVAADLTRGIVVND